jgi:hypothetical protein
MFSTKMVFPIEQGFQIRCIQSREFTVIVDKSGKPSSSARRKNVQVIKKKENMFEEEASNIVSTKCFRITF